MAQLQSGTRIYGTANVDVLINIGANAYFSTNVLSISNGTISNVYVNSTTIVIQSNTTTNTVINSTAIEVNGIIANNTFGSAGQILYSNGSGSYWAAPAAGFTNGQSISVNTFQITGQFLAANGYTGSVGAYLAGNTTGGVSWTSSTGPQGPSGYQGSVGFTGSVGNFSQTLTVALSDETSALAGSNTVAVATIRIPFALTLTSPYCRVSLTTAGTATTNVDIRFAGTSIFADPTARPSLAATVTTNTAPKSMSATGLASVADDTEVKYYITAAAPSAAGLKATLYFLKN